MTPFLFPTSSLVETPVSVLPFRSGKDVMINAIKLKPFVEVTFLQITRTTCWCVQKCLTPRSNCM